MYAAHVPKALGLKTIIKCDKTKSNTFLNIFQGSGFVCLIQMYTYLNFTGSNFIGNNKLKTIMVQFCWVIVWSTLYSLYIEPLYKTVKYNYQHIIKCSTKYTWCHITVTSRNSWAPIGDGPRPDQLMWNQVYHVNEILK